MSDYLGDFVVGDNVYIERCFVDGTTGSPTAVSGGSACVKNMRTQILQNSGVGSITTSGGLATLTVFTGSGTWGKGDYSVFMGAGTVSGTSVIGYTLAQFSIGRTTAITYSSNVLQWNSATVATPNVSGVPKVDLVDWLGSAPNALIAGRVDVNAAAVTVSADVLKWNGTAVSAPATAGIPEVNVKNINNVAAATPGAAGGILIAGSNAATTLASLSVTGATTLTGSASLAAGLNIAQSATNQPGITITGNGSGAGIKTTGGATGHGLAGVGGATSGDGMNLSSPTLGHGLTAAGIGTGRYGFNVTSGSSYAALFSGVTAGMFIGGVTGLTVLSANGHGLDVSASGTDKNGINIFSDLGHGIYTQADISAAGAKHGIYALSSSGATGDGIKAEALSTNGNGLNLVGKGTGDGILATGGASAGGDGVAAIAGGGLSINGTVTTATNLTTNNDKTGYALSTAGNNAAADAFLLRDLATGASATDRNVQNTLRAIRNKTTLTSSTLTVFQEDDATPAWTAVTTTTTAMSITSVDPA